MADVSSAAEPTFSDALKNVYEKAGALSRYFDDSVPCDLYRGLHKRSVDPLMQPTLVGRLYGSGPDFRAPDVLVEDAHGHSPQYADTPKNTVIETEDKKKPLTGKIVNNASDYIVKGCRTMAGDHRGLSVFDGKNTRLPFKWFRLPKGVKIPPGLAITRDAAWSSKKSPVHYTIAPKDDMPLSLYLKTLEGLTAHTVEAP